VTVGLAVAEANALLAAQFQGVAYASPGVWIKLHVGDPGAAGTANPAGNTVRADGSGCFGTDPVGGVITNDADIGTTEWASVSTSETYTHVSRWSASTAGAFLGSGTITTAAVTAGDPFTIPAGDLTATIPTAA
jgi:hypothetical protein